MLALPDPTSEAVLPFPASHRRLRIGVRMASWASRRSHRLGQCLATVVAAGLAIAISPAVVALEFRAAGWATGQPSNIAAVVEDLGPPLEATEPAPPASDDEGLALQAGDGLNQHLRRLVLQHLPDHYVDDRKWDRTSEIKTLLPRSEPLVMKHGTWQRYEITPVEPERTLAIRLRNVRNLDSGRLAFDLECDLTCDLMARQAEWRRGVQLYSVHADATIQATVTLACQLGITFDFKAEPTLILDPHVEQAQWELTEFRIHRISKVGGEVAQQVTRRTRKWLDEHAEQYNTKLADTLNQQLQKKPERLKIPLHKK